MKSQVKRFLNRNYVANYDRYAALVKPVFGLLKNGKNEKRVFVLAPADPGSLGDEAMLAVSVHQLAKHFDKVCVISGTTDWDRTIKQYNLPCQFMAIRLIYWAPLSWLQLYRYAAKLRPEQVCVIGADVIDGFYSPWFSLSRLSVLDLSEAYALSVKMLGFSFNSQPDERCADYLRTISTSKVQLYARDRVSHERMLARDIANTLTADIAFLLEPINCQSRIESISASFACLNICSVHVRLFGQSYIDKIKRFYTDLMQQHLDLEFLLISHDRRIVALDHSDWTLLKEFRDELSPELQSRAHLMSEDLLAAEAKWLCSQAKFCVVGRKHMGVGALGGETPTMFFGYQGKQAGLLASFNIDPKLALIDAEQSTEEWLQQFDNFYKELPQIKASIIDALPGVKKLSQKNFA